MSMSGDFTREEIIRLDRSLRDPMVANDQADKHLRECFISGRLVPWGKTHYVEYQVETVSSDISDEGPVSLEQLCWEEVPSFVSDYSGAEFLLKRVVYHHVWLTLVEDEDEEARRKWQVTATERVSGAEGEATHPELPRAVVLAFLKMLLSDEGTNLIRRADG